MKFAFNLATGFVFLSAGFALWNTGCSGSADDSYASYSDIDEEASDSLLPDADEKSPDQNTDVSDSDEAEAVAVDTDANDSSSYEGDSTTVNQTADAEGVSNDTGEAAPESSDDESTGSVYASAKSLGGDETNPLRPAEFNETADGADASPIAPRVPKVLIPNRTFRKEGPNGAIRISYDDFDLLKVLNMDPVTSAAPAMMPEWLKNLDGARVRVRGFMYPTFEESGLEFFVLARDNQICCFGRNPKIYDLIEVSMKKGKTTDYIENRPFDVVGVFRINPEIDDEGGLYRLYQIDDAVVISR